MRSTDFIYCTLLCSCERDSINSLFTSKHALKLHPNVAVTVSEQPVRPATFIHNLGVVYDQPLSMIQHANSICRVGPHPAIPDRGCYENNSTCPGHISPRLLQCCAIRFTRVSNQQNAATTEYMRTNDYEDKTP